MRPIERVGIRFAEELDAAAIQAIYAPYCQSSAVSFGTKAPSVEEIGQRIRKISDQFQWIGLGRALYTSLFRILTLQDYYKIYAGITLPNAASVGLHEAMGFKPVGI